MVPILHQTKPRLRSRGFVLCKMGTTAFILQANCFCRLPVNCELMWTRSQNYTQQISTLSVTSILCWQWDPV